METSDQKDCVEEETPRMGGEGTVAGGARSEASGTDLVDDASDREPVPQREKQTENSHGDVVLEEPTKEYSAPGDNTSESSERTRHNKTSNSENTGSFQMDEKGKGREVLPAKPLSSTGEFPAGPSTARPPTGTEPFSSLPARDSKIPWEVDAERPPQKLPIFFKDAVGRRFIIPWRRAKTWEGMKMTIDAAFDKVEGALGAHVPAGHYDLYFTASSSTDQANNIGHDAGQLDAAAAPSTSAPGPSTSAPAPSRQSSVIVLPDFWEDLIRPGMSISMTMWPIGVCPPLPYRGHWNNRGAGVDRRPNGPPGVGGANVAAAPPPPGHVANGITIINASPPMRRAKTRVNPGRPVRK